MTRPEQVAEELRVVEKLVRFLQLPLAAAPTPCEPPLPDFELRLADGRSIGLEVTEAPDPEVAAAWLGTGRRFEDLIKAALRRQGLTARVSGSVHVEDLIGLRGAGLKPAAENVAAVIARRLPAGFGPTTGSKFPGLGYLGFLAAEPAPNVDVAFATVGDPLGPDVIQLAIDRKAPKVSGYRGLAASEHWLLVVGGATFSGYVTVEDAMSRTFHSPFDRTVFLDDSDDQHHDLTTVDGGEASEH